MTDDKSPLKTDRDQRAWVARLGRESVQSARARLEESDRVKEQLEAARAPAQEPRVLSLAVHVKYFPDGRVTISVGVQGLLVTGSVPLERGDAQEIGQAVTEAITAAGLRALVGGT